MMDFDKIKNENFRTRITDEIEYLKNNNSLNIFENKDMLSDQEQINKRLLDLEIILKKSEEPKKHNIFSEVDKYIYKKPWNRLSSFHKIVKIKEFIKDNYGEGELQTKIINEIVKAIQENKMNTKKQVVYDFSKEKIESVPVLKVNLENNEYKLSLK